MSVVEGGSVTRHCGMAPNPSLLQTPWASRTSCSIPLPSLKSWLLPLPFPRRQIAINHQWLPLSFIPEISHGLFLSLCFHCLTPRRVHPPNMLAVSRNINGHPALADTLPPPMTFSEPTLSGPCLCPQLPTLPALTHPSPKLPTVSPFHACPQSVLGGLCFLQLLFSTSLLETSQEEWLGAC